MDDTDKRLLEREALRNMIQQWNANRVDLFELSEPNENLEFHGVMRFYFQDRGQKIATKCIRVASDATVSDVIETLIEKFRPDMRMLSLGSYSLWETHGAGDERRLAPDEKPLLVQLKWHADDREGRFLLKCSHNDEVPLSNEKGDQNFKRKLSKREKKELKKKEKLSRLKSDVNDENRPISEKLYTELPETSFTRSISNPEAVMRRRRQQQLEKRLQQYRSKDGGPDTGGTLRIYGSSLCPDVPYKTLLLSVGDSAAHVLRETLEKYGLSRHDPHQYCIVQVDTSDNSEYILEDDDCPLAIVMTHPHHSSIMFHVRRRPADAQVRRRKKKTVGAGGGANNAGGGSHRPGNEPMLVEVAPDGTPLENGRRVRITDVVEVGSADGAAIQLYGPSIQPRHCAVTPAEGGGYLLAPLHTDALVTLNHARVSHPQRLQHGCIIKFGRVSTFRFVDPAAESLQQSRSLSNSQHFPSPNMYDRSPENGNGAMSPTSLDNTNSNMDNDFTRTMSPDGYSFSYTSDTAYNNNNTLKLDGESIKNQNDEGGWEQNAERSHNKDNYETTFDVDGNVETKSICSAKSGGSGHESRMSLAARSSTGVGQEAILPAVLEFPEAGQAQFLSAVISRLDPHAPAFKLAPVYTLYLCARYRASTHYRPELTPTERAHKLTAFLYHVATLIHATVQERCADSAAQAFWMANASELLHFLKSDRHISSFSTQAQDLLSTTVQSTFSNLVTCFQEELGPPLATLVNPNVVDATEATGGTLRALVGAMVLLRRCRVNAALTLQLFSHLFHYVNCVCFNKLVVDGGMVSAAWGNALSARLALLAAWAERQGLEVPAECHLARTIQAAYLIQGDYQTPEAAREAVGACFKLNSVQVRALLAPLVAPNVLEAAVMHARALADELCRADHRQITLEEREYLQVELMIPSDGFSTEVVRGVPVGLAEFVAPLQRAGLCRLQHQPHARGLWTVYMTGYGQPRRPPDPRVTIIQLNKNSNGMGLSIVAAKGAGQSKLGIYIKSVVPGGAAAADGRLQAGDQLLSVDGHSLQGITQEKAAEYLVRTGPTVTLEVAKQGAVLHGLATLLHQPAANTPPDWSEDLQIEDRSRRNSGTFTNPHPIFCHRADPLTELATAGYVRRASSERCHFLRESSTSSCSDDSDDVTPPHRNMWRHPPPNIPRLIVTCDHENNCFEEFSPDTPSYPRPIPVFTFTCEDFDEMNNSNNCEQAPPVPELPACCDHDSEDRSDAPPIPPRIRPVDPRLTLELFQARPDAYRGRCTGVNECVSACSCCRAPQPDPQPIPYIDEPAFDPVIFEQAGTPKTRRILPALSLELPDEPRPSTADAICQTPGSPMEIATPKKQSPPKVKQTQSPKAVPTPTPRTKLDLKIDIKSETNRSDVGHCRLRRMLFASESVSSKSEEKEVPSVYSTSDSPEDTDVGKDNARQILDSVDRKSWKSPDEFRPALGRVRALTKHFNDINLTYCVKNYKRNCSSSPNLSARGEKITVKDSLPTSVSLADITFQAKSETSSSREKLSEEEVKSIIIQLEDWSRIESRGSEDTLAQGNEFELPNLPSEERPESVASLVFNEIVEKKPRTITLDNIKLKSGHSSFNSDRGKDSNVGSLEKMSSVPKVVGMTPKKAFLDVIGGENGESRRGSYTTIVQSCPDVSLGSSRGRSALTASNPHNSCPALGKASCGVGARRASERDLPRHVQLEPVKPSKSTPALHHATSPHATLSTHSGSGVLSPTSAPMVGPGAWSGRSRSSHNLSDQNQFYQNLPAHMDHQDRWSVHGSRPLPPPDPQPDQLLQHHNAISARAAKLAEMSEEVNRRHQQQHQLQQQQIHQQQQLQQQQHLQQQQLHQQQHMQQQQLQQQQQQRLHPAPLTAHPYQSEPLLRQVGGASGERVTSPLAEQHHAPLSPQFNHLQTQRYDWQSGGPPSPLRAQPPVAPKPRPHDEVVSPAQPDEERYVASAQEPPGVAIYGVQGAGTGPWRGNHAPPHTPWERDERERMLEARREANRARRDATIAQLLALGAARTPVQNQQLRALQLERDFERRAMHHQESGGGDGAGDEDDQDDDDDDDTVMMQQGPMILQQGQMSQGPTQGGPGQMSTGKGQMAPGHGQVASGQGQGQMAPGQGHMVPGQGQMAPGQGQMAPGQGHMAPGQGQMAPGQGHIIPGQGQMAPGQGQTGQNPLPAPPKSILKVNRPDTNGHAHGHDVVPGEEQPAPLAGSMAALSLGGSPPPPPSRGSSFAVMAGRARALSPPNIPQTHQPPPQSPVRDKRVSFHERGSPPAPPPPATSPPPLDAPAPASVRREDPDRFIEEAQNMLAEPTTPTTPTGGSVPTATPGVIGAQEVYRDPRLRRLAEKERGAAPVTVPETLSFKEKMKMFALEAGDPNTPKDKVKISRAQRDIDAVH